MTRPVLRLALLAAALSLLTLTPSAFAARGFSLGVTAGEVTSTSAVLWAKANRSGGYRAALSARLGPNTAQTIGVIGLRARRRDDNTIQTRVTGLRPDT